MSSSQGGRTATPSEVSGTIPSGVIKPGYSYDEDSVRDASDWTRQLKEKRAHRSYSTLNTGNKTTGGDPWFKYGNQFRLTYAFGKFKCDTCNANGFIPAVIGSS
jgi:hypothetical protein